MVKCVIGPALAAVLLATTASAQDRSLPSFTVATASGGTVASARLTTSPKWLLVYVSPEGAPGERLLRALDGWAASQESQVVIVAAGPAASIDTVVRPLLPATSATIAVYADVDGGVARALGLTSVPALIGVDGGAINWTVQGVLNDPQMVESLVRSWLRP